MTPRLWLCLSVVLAAGLTGCNRDRPTAPPPPPPEVKVSSPVTRTVVDEEVFTGRTEASESIPIRARVTGHLMSAPFKEGGLVKKGDLLFVIDQRMFKADLAEAQAALGQSEARFARLERDLQRARNLLPSGAIGREEFEKIRGDHQEAEATVKLSAARVDKARLNLEYTEVKAPFDGRIGRRMVDPGTLVKADDTLLATLGTEGIVYAYFDVDERTILRQLLRAGAVEAARAGNMPVELSLVDEEGTFPHGGVINFVDNRLDTATGSLWLRAHITKPKRQIAPGMFVRVRVPLSDPYPALTVLEQAVGNDQGQKFVYVVDADNKAHYRRVETGRLVPVRQGQETINLRVIRSGLKEGERIVVTGLQRVRSGAPVTPKFVETLPKDEK